MNIGDLIFFTEGASRGFFNKLSNAMIARWTHGPYVHVEIIYAIAPVNVIHAIGAHANGISKDVIAFDPAIHHIAEVGPLVADADVAKNALAWALKQEGSHYGWLDIMDQAIDRLIPGNRIHLLASGQMDCSDFAAYYLNMAGVALPETMKQPYTVSPNDLARFFQLP